MAANAQKNFDLANQVKVLDDKEIYSYNEEEQDRIFDAKPWKEDVHFFKCAKISAVALIKMVMHTKSGVPNEVMGLMQGKVTADGTFIILDAFPLPVEGTETRVNAGAGANEFMVTFTEACERLGKKEHVVGWYHSHPEYGCWLSGIDVQTQMCYQQHQEPFLAIVIDPVRTCSAGKVEIGAFRTYPAGYTPPDSGPSEYQSIPLDKIEDFGVHCKSYYPVPVEFFKNSLDTTLLELLWNKYWIDTLSSSPLLHNRQFCLRMIQDTTQKLEQIDTASVAQSRFRMTMHEPKKKREEHPLNKVAMDAAKNAGEQVQGLTNQVVKYSLFGSCLDKPTTSGSANESQGPAPMETT
jgi:COP9 signalosome complex subunit 5